MKRVEIIQQTLVPDEQSKEPGVMKTVYVDSVFDLDDDVAGAVVAAGRARYVAKDDKDKYVKSVKDTTEQAEKALATRAVQVDPAVAQAAAIGKAIADALNAKPAEGKIKA